MPGPTPIAYDLPLLMESARTEWYTRPGWSQPMPPRTLSNGLVLHWHDPSTLRLTLDGVTVLKYWEGYLHRAMYLTTEGVPVHDLAYLSRMFNLYLKHTNSDSHLRVAPGCEVIDGDGKFVRPLMETVRGDDRDPEETWHEGTVFYVGIKPGILRPQTLAQMNRPNGWYLRNGFGLGTGMEKVSW